MYFSEILGDLHASDLYYKVEDTNIYHAEVAHELLRQNYDASSRGLAPPRFGHVSNDAPRVFELS